GRLTIAGRDKDVVIIRGANHFTYDIESVVERVDGTVTSFVAATAYARPGSHSDELAVFFVPDSADLDEHRRTIARVRAALARELGISSAIVVPVTEAEFPKTASGKIQRNQLAAALAAGAYADRLARVSDAGGEDGLDVSGLLFERVWLPIGRD